MYIVEDFYREHGKALGLEVIAGAAGLTRPIKVAEAHRPGLSLAGYLKYHASKRILVFGKVEMEYLRDLSPTLRTSRLEELLKMATPAIIVARNYKPVEELVRLAEEMGVPLFRTKNADNGSHGEAIGIAE